MLIQNFLFHRVLGGLKVLIQNFLFHRVLGKVKIYASVSSRTGGRSMFYKHLLFFLVHVLKECLNMFQNMLPGQTRSTKGS